MKTMQSILMRNALDQRAELMKSPNGYRVTIWRDFSIIYQHTFPTWGKAMSKLISDGFRRI